MRSDGVRGITKAERVSSIDHSNSRDITDAGVSALAQGSCKRFSVAKKGGFRGENTEEGRAPPEIN